MFLSIIIPVYNAQQYIKKCVDSLVGLPAYLSRPDSDMEVVLVDDGSNDNSGTICDELAQCDYSFDLRVIHQKNHGVSVARNEGLRYAKGDWIWFIDADDRIDIPLKQINELNLNDAQFVVTGFVWEENDTCMSFGASNGEIPYNLWRCWFRRSTVESLGVHFVVGRKYAEDQEFIVKYLICLGKTDSLAIPDILYHYTMRPGSAMTRSNIKMKQASDLFSVINSLLFAGFRNGAILNSWFWREMKRMIKTLIVVLR